jgi:DNA-binding transcriptional regulator YiaG
MKITTDHPGSSYGRPVILGDTGEPLDDAPGVRAARAALGMSTAELGTACGYSGRTVEDWEQGRRTVPTAALYVMRNLLKRRKRAKA